MSGPGSNKSQIEATRTSSNLTEQDLAGLYDLTKGDRQAQAEVWTALEDFRSGDYRECRERIQLVFGRVGGSLQETANDTPEQRAERIIAKSAADQGKSYKRVATRELVARTILKAEQQVEKARKIVGAFEWVLKKLPSTSNTPAASPAEVDVVAEDQAATDPIQGDPMPVGSMSIATVPAETIPAEPMQEDCTVPADAIKAFKKAKDADEARHKLARFFCLKEVDDEAILRPRALFHLHGGTRGNLVRITSVEKGAVQLEKPQSGDRYKDVVPVAYFMTTGAKGKTHLLVSKQEQPSVAEEGRAEPYGDPTDQPSPGPEDAVVTRASFQMLVSDIGRAKQKLQVFSDLHNVRVGFNVDSKTITDADRGSFRKGDKVKARQQAEIIKSQVSAAVNSARALVQKREQEFRQSKEKVTGSERRPMESCFAPTYLSLHAVEKAMRNLVQGLDAALSLDQDDSGQDDSGRAE